MAGKSSEVEMYPEFVEALRDWPPEDDGRRQTKLEFRDVHSYQDPNCAGLAVGIAIADFATESLWPDKKPIRFSEHETHAEFKSSVTWDPFVELENKREQEKVVAKEAGGGEEEGLQEEEGLKQDGAELGAVEGATEPQVQISAEKPSDDEPDVVRPYEFENPTNEGISCRGQIAYYAAVAMTIQYRHCFFQLVILGSYARFLRWDRSCAVVSRRFNYAEEPDLIFDFYRRLAQLDSVLRGYDPEITYATTEEVTLARRKFSGFLPDGWHGRLELPSKLCNSDIHHQNFRTLTTTTTSTSTRKVKFVICAPIFNPDCYTPFGRSTQRSLALSLGGNNDTICFMKHFHSRNHDFTLKESEVYERLQEKRRTDGANFPRGFCTMIAGGDIVGTKSLGHLYWQKPWVCGNVREPRQLIVHRIFLEEVGRSIRTFTNCKTMLTCVADAMEAHSYLLHELGIFHRDISPGNILMERHSEITGGKVRRGYLIDFDHALDLNQTTDSQSSGCAGTFQFFSAALLSDPEAVQSGVDDRESCLYTIVYLSMLHLKHEYSEEPERLHADLNSLFEGITGFPKKCALLQHMFRDYGWANQNLKDTLAALSNPFLWRHTEPKDDPQLVALQKTLERIREKDVIHPSACHSAGATTRPRRGEYPRGYQAFEGQTLATQYHTGTCGEDARSFGGDRIHRQHTPPGGPHSTDEDP